MHDTATRKALGAFFRDMSEATRAAATVARAPDRSNTSALREMLARTLVTVERLSAAVEHRPAA